MMRDYTFKTLLLWIYCAFFVAKYVIDFCEWSTDVGGGNVYIYYININILYINIKYR